METERKLNLSEDVPLNSGAANIFLNTGKSTKHKSDGTVIHLKAEKETDVGVHINTTFSIASSKKIKQLFILNFLLCALCIAISFTIAFYYWNEMAVLRKQVDVLKDVLIAQNFKPNDNIMEPRPVAQARTSFRGSDSREARMDFNRDNVMNPKRYYVQDLGDDMLLVDSSKKNSKGIPVLDLSNFQKEFMVAHFNGALKETHLGTQSVVGPWSRDMEVSSKNSESKIELNTNYMTMNDSGLYLVYAQVVYITHGPNCFFIWARQPSEMPRLLSTCATGDDSSGRPLDKSQISCSTFTISRLSKGDVINIAQREPNRTVWMRPGYSYFGFVKLGT